MCGIFGTTEAISDEHIAEIKALLNHRGPDSSGDLRVDMQNGSQLRLVHTRLAIQDLSAAGHQPMQSHNGQWQLTFNGEIYNHHQLRKELTTDFRGSSDTETLVEYLARYGIEKTLQSLNGIFAFAAFDKASQKLYLVRDHFGTKPLYFTHHDGCLSFSSEIKPLTVTAMRNRQIDLNALDVFLSLRYTPSTQTLLNGISRLPPGHFLTFDTRTCESAQSSYLDTSPGQFEGSFDDAIEAYHEALDRAVQSQLLSDVPVGVLLSGGIDSAVVAASAASASNDISAFTVGFGSEHDVCEIADAKETADILGLQHHSVIVEPTSLLDCMSDIVHAVEEPLGTTSIMPMWYLTRCAKEKVTVVLTGQGNDEPWGGYKRYQIELLLNRLPFLKAAPFSILQKLAPFFSDDAQRRGLSCLGEPVTAQRFLDAYALFDSKQIAGLTGTSHNQALTPIRYWLDLLSDHKHATDAEKMMRIDSRMNLADDLLLYGDKISMACALEARVPMLDKDLVAFVESLPLNYRSKLGGGKLVHKAMAEKYLPSRIVNRKKLGFQVPFAEWSRSVWRDYVEAHLLDKNRTIYQFMNPDAVDAIWQSHLSGKLDCSRQIFSLLTLSLWSDHYL